MIDGKNRVPSRGLPVLSLEMPEDSMLLKWLQAVITAFKEQQTRLNAGMAHLDALDHGQSHNRIGRKP